MSITVRYFASLRDIVACSQHDLDFIPSESVIQIWQRANPKQEIPPKTLCAINADYVDWNTKISDGDEIAFFPPVTGG